MDIKLLIKQKYQEFNAFVESIDLGELETNYSRKELEEFKKELSELKPRSLTYEIGQLTQKMKEAEFPQLLGVHHFPILNKINFLTVEQKIELDKFLLKHRVGNFVSGLWHITRNEKVRKQLEEWLLENEVTEKTHVVLCPGCYDGHNSKMLVEKEKTELENMFEKFKSTLDYELQEELETKYGLSYGCMECDGIYEIENLKKLDFKSFNRMKMKRDDTLDKV